MTSKPERAAAAGPVDEAPRTDPVEVIRSEEQLVATTQVRVSDRAVLRKYVVTETVTQTFQVRREEIRLERESADAVDSSGSGEGRTPFADGPVVEMVLHREVPRVTMDVIATERIRLYVDTVTTQAQMTDQVRQEQLTVEPIA